MELYECPRVCVRWARDVKTSVLVVPLLNSGRKVTSRSLLSFALAYGLRHVYNPVGLRTGLQYPPDLEIRLCCDGM